MNNKRVVYLLLFSVFFVLVFTSYFLEFFSLKLIIGFSVVLLILGYNLERKLNIWQYKIFIFVIFIYPIIETSIKIFNKYFINVQYNPLHILFYCNLLEHFLAGLAVGVIILPFAYNAMNKLNLKEKLMFFVPLVTFICLIYELIGYYFFYIQKSVNYMAILYPDTMRDLTMNILGSIAAYIILYRLKS